MDKRENLTWTSEPPPHPTSPVFPGSFPFVIHSGQISIIPKPELRGFWGSSLIKPPFRVTSADVVIICPDPFPYKLMPSRTIGKCASWPEQCGCRVVTLFPSSNFTKLERTTNSEPPKIAKKWRKNEKKIKVFLQISKTHTAWMFAFFNLFFPYEGLIFFSRHISGLIFQRGGA